MIISFFAHVTWVTVNRLATIVVFGGILFLAGCAIPPPPMMPTYDPQSTVEICAGGECGPAGEKFALDDIAKAIAEMFAINGPGVWDFCPGTPHDRRCTSNSLAYTLQGIISATGYVPGGALRSGAKYDGKRSVRFRVNIPTVVFDTPSVCVDANSTLSVRSAKNIFWRSNTYMCSWGGGPQNIVAEGQYGIDFIDFDRGIMGGEFAIRVSEGGNGYTKGYAITRLSIGMDDIQEAWLRPKGVTPVIRQATATPAPVPPTPQPVLSTPQPVPPSGGSFSRTPLDVTFTVIQPRPDDIAVIIGNANYGQFNNDIPNVIPAYADAEGFKRYVIQALGVREGNIIDLRDASQADLISVFGTQAQHKGRLFNWVKPGLSNVTIYYSGHGAPAGEDGSPYLVPVNANPSTIELNGYPLKVLYDNLDKVPAKSITVVLEACFSGTAVGGSVISNASPVYLKAKTLSIPGKVRVIAAGGGRQMASWEQDKSNGLFTKYYLLGMSGKADAPPSGNGDGLVGLDELSRYLDSTMTYYARRYYGRDQNARFVIGSGN